MGDREALLFVWKESGKKRTAPVGSRCQQQTCLPTPGANAARRLQLRHRVSEPTPQPTSVVTGPLDTQGHR